MNNKSSVIFIKFGDKEIELTIGKYATQAHGAVMARLGSTQILSTITRSESPNPNFGFFPLTVSYLERAYASGKIPGGFIKRETKPSEREVLISRLIDRGMRPLFADDFCHEVQIVSTLMSFDKENDTDILAIIASSVAAYLSDIPMKETIAAVKVGYINESFVLNPTIHQAPLSSLNITVTGTKHSVVMVESSSNELSPELVLEAISFAHENIKSIISQIEDLCAPFKSEKIQVESVEKKDISSEIKTHLLKDLEAALYLPKKSERKKALASVEKKALEKYVSEEVSESSIIDAVYNLSKSIVRNKIIKDGVRIDGRGVADIRNISCETHTLRNVHGSALFERGETQVLSVVTLGGSQDEQILDDILENKSQSFMLHYNFPPFSVGEVSQLKPPGRREIGHGNLALKALLPVIPAKASFPYTIRTVAEVLSCNGSSSMGTVCATSMALMEAGVPIKSPVAGIAMGLIKEGNDYKVLSDIMGDEDHLGDMDFKITSSIVGVTALQMDIKIDGVSFDILKQAITQALSGIEHILSKMDEAIQKPNTELNHSAPKLFMMKIAREKIREVIGSGGKVIKDICEKSGAKVNVDDDGNISIFSSSQVAIDIARTMISAITDEAELGKIYDGFVVKITDFGMFVRIFGATEGLVHISEISDQRVETIEGLYAVGDKLRAKVIDIDKKTGKIKLSVKAALSDENRKIHTPTKKHLF